SSSGGESTSTLRQRSRCGASESITRLRSLASRGTLRGSGGGASDMTPSVIAGAARRADHERVRQDRAADIGRGARVVLYTSSDCWRGSGVSYIEIANALDAC